MSAEATHRYHTVCSWEGSTGTGYDHYNRTHRASAPPAQPDLDLSADPAFGGHPDKLNPEQLLVMAASSCQLLSFLAVAARARIDVISYHDHAEAVMPEADRPARITEIRLRPHIIVRAPATEKRVRDLTDIAHRECFIANSLQSRMTIQATVHIVDSSEPHQHDRRVT